MSTAGEASVELAIIGGGPTASSLLERLVANAPLLLSGRSVRVHIIDPQRPGVGRVWRADNYPGLWMNSLAEDVTLFTDESVVCDGPIVPGPTLHEWAHSNDDAALASLAPPELIAEIKSLDGKSFPTRRVQSAYLEWFHRQVRATLPEDLEVVVHDASAIDLFDEDEHQVVVLAGDRDPLRVDVVILALGHLDALPDERGLVFDRFATEHSLTYLAAGHTAELDLSGLQPGADVISVGFGQAFTDLLVLVTEGRGGHFEERADGTLHYKSSGLEPIVHVGSRRGVPYRSKLNYRLQAPPAPLPRFLDDVAIDELLRSECLLDFHHDVFPLVSKEVGWAYYHELFHAHSERVEGSWSEFDTRYADAHDESQIKQVVASFVPDVSDHFDITRLDAPLAGQQFTSSEELHHYVRNHVAADLARRTNASYSADLGAFNALLQTFGTIGRIAASGRLSVRSRVQDLSGWWFSFFMYFASGPPPARLRQLLALEEAGLVRFIGANVKVRTDTQRGAFVATSSSHSDEVVAHALIDAQIAASTVSRSANPLLQNLYERGDVVEEVVTDQFGWQGNTGKVLVSGPALNVARAGGPPHPRRHAAGIFTSRPAGGAFARPRTNAPTFRQNDAIARAVLTTLSNIGQQRDAQSVAR